MDSPLERARKLITLAVNPGAEVEESRSAAAAAVRLIHQHDLLKRESIFHPFGSRINSSYVSPPRPAPAPPTVKKPESPEIPRRNRQELRELVQEKVGRFITFLCKKAKVGENKRYSSVYLTDKAITNKELHPKDRVVFHHYLSVALAARVKEGILQSKAGGNGGYSLADTLQPEVKGKPKEVGEQLGSSTIGTR